MDVTTSSLEVWGALHIVGSHLLGRQNYGIQVNLILDGKLPLVLVKNSAFDGHSLPGHPIHAPIAPHKYIGEPSGWLLPCLSGHGHKHRRTGDEPCLCHQFYKNIYLIYILCILHIHFIDQKAVPATSFWDEGQLKYQGITWTKGCPYIQQVLWPSSKQVREIVSSNRIK